MCKRKVSTFIFYYFYYVLLFINNLSKQRNMLKQINIHSYLYQVKTTADKDIKAVIGLPNFAGVFKSGHQNIYDLWNTDGTGAQIFHATMSLATIKSLLQVIQFDGIATRNYLKEFDKYATIREVFESLVSNCKKAYCGASYVAVDEKLEVFTEDVASDSIFLANLQSMAYNIFHG